MQIIMPKGPKVPGKTVSSPVLLSREAQLALQTGVVPRSNSDGLTGGTSLSPYLLPCVCTSSFDMYLF